MNKAPFTLTAHDGLTLSCYKWECTAPKLSFIIIHGMAEHAQRYDRFASQLAQHGANVYAIDLRGHGQTSRQTATRYFGPRPWCGLKNVLGDIEQLTRHVRSLSPELPVILFGHSMGSILSLRTIQTKGELFDGCILCGVSAGAANKRNISPILARVIALFKAPTAPSQFLNSMSFGAYNAAFEPVRTPFDWLSRDEAEVDKYIADPLCGFVCTPHMMADVSKCIRLNMLPRSYAGIPKELPVHIIAGDKDPVARMGAAVHEIAELMSSHGIKVTTKLYPDARHELLNEINRQEVTDDILNHLNLKEAQ